MSDLRERLEALRQEFRADRRDLETGGDPTELRNKYLSRRSGSLTQLPRELGSAPPEERPSLGRLLNEVKKEVEEGIEELEAAWKSAEKDEDPSGRRLDVTLPGRRPPLGRLHPVTQVRRRIEAIFLRMGYAVEEGPQIETDYYNFEALNFPPGHPARDTQDTFFLAGDRVLRTHTSPVQVRTMEQRRPPVRIIAPGAVYRRDSDPSHSPMFHQVEGLVVDRGITFADLRGTLEEMLHQLFSPEVQLRLRPSFFPFTEPSAEMDMSCLLCAGEGCPVCKRTGWLELGGCGIVDPGVYGFVGYDPEEISGFAFGFGIDRMAMLKYGVDHIGTLFESDARFLEQFPFEEGE